jgi:hypothetical protein
VPATSLSVKEPPVPTEQEVEWTPHLVRMLWRRENLLPLQGTELQLLGSLACILDTIPVYKSTRYHIPSDKKLPFHQFQSKVTRQQTQQIRLWFHTNACLCIWQNQGNFFTIWMTIKWRSPYAMRLARHKFPSTWTMHATVSMLHLFLPTRCQH